MPVHVEKPTQGIACSIIGSMVSHGVIDHVGLLAANSPVTLQPKQSVAVYDMPRPTPPPNIPPPDTANMQADVIGSILDFDSQTLKAMRQWAKRVIRLAVEIQYVVLPAAQQSRTDAQSGSPIYVSFSCVGFVERCYRDVAKTPLVDDGPHLPPIDLETLLRVWPQYDKQLNHSVGRRVIGLHGPEPWPILMPAYLFHAIRHFDAHGRNAGPYQPQSGDWRFAPR